MASTKLTQTKISDTYGGILHSNGEALPVSNLVDIYDGVGNKSSLKLGRSCNGAMFCGPVVINGSLSANSMTTTAQLSASTQFDILNLLNVLHPINSIIFTFNNSNPGTRTGWAGTTWINVGQGKYITSVGTASDVNNTSHTFNAGNNNGEYTHKLEVSEMPAHSHSIKTEKVSSSDDNAGVSGYLGSSSRNLKQSNVTPNPSLTIQNTGGSDYHNNITPSFALYVWQRTA